jgi:hypothetical protein
VIATMPTGLHRGCPPLGPDRARFTGDGGVLPLGGPVRVAAERHEVVEKPGGLDLRDAVRLVPDPQDVGEGDLRRDGEDDDGQIAAGRRRRDPYLQVLAAVRGGQCDRADRDHRGGEAVAASGRRGVTRE